MFIHRLISLFLIISIATHLFAMDIAKIAQDQTIQRDPYRELLNKLLESDGDVNAHCTELATIPVTPLMLCTALHLPEFIDPLIIRGALVNGTPELRPLHVAASAGFNSIIDKLLRHQADIESLDSKDKTALHLATENGHLKTVQLLLDRGANIDAEAFCSYKIAEDLTLECTVTLESMDTPLLIAIRYNHVEIIRLLLQRGTQKQLTPALHEAISQNNIPLLELLIQHGADVNAIHYRMNALSLAHRPVQLEPLDKPKNSDFIRIAKLIRIPDNSSLIKLLLKHGANPLKKNDSGENIIPPKYYIFPNHRKASCANYFENRQAYLASSSLTIEQCNQIFLIAFFLRDTPLIAKIIESLKDSHRGELRSMLNNHSIDRDGNTVLMDAVQQKDTELIELLLKTGLMNCNKKNKEGFTALHYALLYNSEDVMFYLEDNVHEIMNIINQYVTVLNDRAETIQKIVTIMQSSSPLTSKQNTDIQSMINENKCILSYTKDLALAASNRQLTNFSALIAFIIVANIIPELKNNNKIACLINKIHGNEKIVNLLIQAGAYISAETLALAAAVNYNISTALLLLRCNKSNILA